MTAESLDDLVARQENWSQAHMIAVQAREWLDRDGLIKRPRDQAKIVAIVERAASTAIAEYEAEIVALRARAERAEAAIEWALGEGRSDFRPRNEGEGQYYWRKELRDRARLAEKDKGG